MKLGNLKTVLFASAAVAAVSVAAPMEARADAYAAAGFRISDFSVDVGSAFTVNAFLLTGNTANRGATGTFVPGAFALNVGSLNIGPACVDASGIGGTLCDDIADNLGDNIDVLGNVPANGSFGRSDIGYKNTIINSTTAGAGADGEWAAISEARSTFPTGASGANVAGNVLNWTFSVAKDASRAMTFSYLADVVFELARETVGDFVNATIEFSITIDGDVDGDGVAGANEFVNNDNVNLSALLDEDGEALILSESFSSGFSVPALISACTVATGVCAATAPANRSFSLNFRVSSSANVNALEVPVVPEPATMGLLGLGFAAAGIAFRRRRAA